MDFKTVREFHWLTKLVILLTGLVFAIYLTAILTHLLGLTHVSQGLGMMLFSMVAILMQLFPVILVIIVLCIIAARIKEWIEKYMDATLSKMDALMENKSTSEDTSAKLAVMSTRIEEIEKKIDNVSNILEKVAD